MSNLVTTGLSQAMIQFGSELCVKAKSLKQIQNRNRKNRGSEREIC
jgi:hypothetical protein